METKGFSKWIVAAGNRRLRLRNRWHRSTWRWAIAAALVLGSAWALVEAQTFSSHIDPVNGVLRVVQPWAPRGDCVHCHDMHTLDSGGPPYPGALFAENANALCYTADGASPCHQLMPTNYPSDETTRIPEGFPDAGYFEYNSGGAKNYGVEFRNRWTGQVLYDDPSVVGPAALFVSPHRNDTDMPRIDPAGRGSCLNCHDAHQSANPFDHLLNTYRGIGGFEDPAYPTRYQLCFDCHSAFGPAGMNATGKLIQDFYDSTINGTNAGHQIKKNPVIAISWPSHINVGDKLACYDCHNPHGSRGYNNLGANAYLLSDQRPGWYGLTDIKDDAVQSRRFCLGCHIPSDGVPGSNTVEGIVMNALPSKGAHGSTDTKACNSCHGADYARSTDNNAHNPAK